MYVHMAKYVRFTPKIAEEMDSFMYQTVGHGVVSRIAEAMSLPLVARALTGTSKEVGMSYEPTEGDEVEDLLALLQSVLEQFPDVRGVSVGAILSDYQRIRVENVCARLGLTCLAFLWRRSQPELLNEMVQTGLTAVLVKVAAMGLKTCHLGKTLGQMQPTLTRLNQQFEVHECGEGGEYETITVDCALFHSQIVLDKTRVVCHSDDAFAPVAYLEIGESHLELKPGRSATEPWSDKVAAVVAATAELEDDRNEEGLTAEKPEESRDLVAEPVVICNSEPITAQSPDFCVISNLYSTSPGLTVNEETQQVLEAAKARLEAEGLGLANVLLVHLLVSSMDIFKDVNKAYIQFFGTNPPARACVAVGQCITGRLQVDLVASTAQSG